MEVIKSLEDISCGDTWGRLTMPESKSSGVFYFRKEVRDFMAKTRKRGNSHQIYYFDPNGKRVRKSFRKRKD
jgi:hypothetical protein